MIRKAANALGVTPDSRVKVLIFLEGVTDISALKNLSRALHKEDNSMIDLTNDPRIAFVLMGGSSLKHWVDGHYLKELGRKEFHLYDSDVKSYKDTIQEVNDRKDGSYGVLTKKHEIENYLHSEAIRLAYGVDIDVQDRPGEDKKGIPKLFGEAYSIKENLDGVMKETAAKKYLSNKAFPAMTAKMIRERDPEGEVEGWFRKIESMIKNEDK